MIKQLAISEFNPMDKHTIWDVRDADKFKQGHIEYAINVPLATIDKQLLDQTVGDIYVLCGGGSKAQKAVQLLESLDDSRTFIHLTGGTREAMALGMKIISDERDE